MFFRFDDRRCHCPIGGYNLSFDWELSEIFTSLCFVVVILGACLYVRRAP